MRYKILLTALFAFCISMQNVFAESEPNDNAATANVLALNGSINGTINGATIDQDWFKITATGDGLLSLTLTPGTANYIRIYLYDGDGTTLLNSSYSNTSLTMNTDGLAAGTYYIQVKAYNNGETITYGLTNTFTTPTQSNDTEPNGTVAQAKNLPVGGTKTGHINYYYNLNRDTLDWYKITTPSDGNLTLNFTSHNGQYVYFELFDNDGITPINSSYTNGSGNSNTYGLAAGTYYVRIKSYNADGFAPYTLSDSLFVPSQVNDNEPNGTKAQALALTVNSSTTGHIGYYYQNHRDTLDWYKLTLPSDASLHLNLASNNGIYVYFELFDNDGITPINISYTNATGDSYTDGLGAGTYYIRIRTYNDGQFAPYTLTNTLNAYSGNDAEPNNYAAQANTILSNQANYGHINFYYNKVKDTVDWFKINYTGTDGNMSVASNLSGNYYNGDNYTWMQVYKDTATAPVYSGYSNGSFTANLTALTAGYYYVKIFTYNSTGLATYSITPTFTQVNTARIKLDTTTLASDCSSTNSLSVKCSGGQSPYSVQLLRYGVAYGTPQSVKKAFTFSNLPSGVYSAVAYSDGATGSAYGSLKAITLAPVPSGLNTTNITSTQAKLNWTAQSACVSYYSVQYRVVGTTSWTTKKTNGPVASYTAKNLTPSANYEWQVAAVDSANGVSGTGNYAGLGAFTTAAGFTNNIIAKNTVNENNNRLVVYPNPVKTFFSIQFNSAKQDERISVTIKNINGNVVWSAGNTNSAALVNTKVDASKFANGIYILQINDAGNKPVATQKIIIAH